MDKIINNAELTRVFERQTTTENIKSILSEFDKKRNELTYKKGIYIWFAWVR